jgi:acyl-CoA thioesterase-1
MRAFFRLFIFLLVISAVNCSTDREKMPIVVSSKNYTYLALGDSYTKGESVCNTCGFPIQLSDSLKKNILPQDNFIVKEIAQTGWTTSDLKQAIASENPSNNYNLVTLLIGVNNQYQRRSFSLYEQEFPELVSIATQKAAGIKNNVIVISIPDYAFTPFGSGNAKISAEIDMYNNFAKDYCAANGIKFINITNITRAGLINPNLVASDGLHPSEIAYTKFVQSILPMSRKSLGL